MEIVLNTLPPSPSLPFGEFWTNSYILSHFFQASRDLSSGWQEKIGIRKFQGDFFGHSSISDDVAHTMLSHLFSLWLLLARLWPSYHGLDEPVFEEPLWDDQKNEHFKLFSFAGHLTKAAARFWLPINFSVGQQAERSAAQQSRTLSIAE